MLAKDFEQRSLAAARERKPGEIGNAITIGPYVTLARNAVPATGFSSLNDLDLSDWLKQMDFEPLTNLKR
ncbi:MAG: histidine decarboxylase, pyruvoyl type [Raoultibacter sp.]